MYKRLTHIGIAVKSVEQSSELFSKLFDMNESHTEEIAEQKVKATFFKIGEGGIELLEPTSPDSAIAKFIEKRGEGVHHLSFEVDDIDAEIVRLKAEGFQMIDEKPRVGADGYRIAFLHPESTNGVLVEISQKMEKMEHTMDSAAKKIKLTVDDYSCLGETTQRIELINGEIVLPFGPDSLRERVQLLLSLQIEKYVYEHSLGIVYHFPIDVFISDTFFVRPDICFVSKERDRISDGRTMKGMPDLIVEICEQKIRGQIQTERCREYVRHGAKEYWIVFIDRREIEVHSYVSTGQETTQVFSYPQQMVTPLFRGAQFNLKVAFA